MLIVVTGTDMYADGNLQTGLWLSELTHIYHCAEEAGYEITVASPKGGNVPVDPESLKPMMLDKLSKDYWDDLEFRRELQHAKSLAEVSGQLSLTVFIWQVVMVRCMIFRIILSCKPSLKKQYENDKEGGSHLSRCLWTC